MCFTAVCAADEGRPVTAVDLEDLPLWRVQWAVLPGTMVTLHVHVPHYGKFEVHTVQSIPLWATVKFTGAGLPLCKAAALNQSPLLTGQLHLRSLVREPQAPPQSELR